MKIWKDIKGFEGIYQVSNYGRVKRIDRISSRLKDGCYLKLSDHYKGYLTVKLIQKRVFVHKLVTQAFLGERPKGLQTNHKDCNKKNNHINNLEYVTQSENMRHASLNGLRPSQRGKNNSFYGKKHTEESLEKMRNKVFSPETRLKMSISAKLRVRKHSYQ